MNRSWTIQRRARRLWRCPLSLRLIPFGAILAAALTSWWARPVLCEARSTSPDVIVAAGAQPPRFQLQGAGSCAAASCHNAGALGGRREYAVALEREPADPWHFKDKHAQAYEVLFNDRSRTIEKNLKGAADLQHAEPWLNQQCLRCHVHPDFEREPAFRRHDGVSCEACHGAAEHWLADHFRFPLSGAERRVRGMNDTRSLPSRIDLCLDCHIGGPGEMDVNHDLIAAGHPRLNFEFSAFHHALHKHWDFAKDKDPQRDARGRKDFEARAWALGQVASAHAALNLLAERAADERRPWPEFGEYDCYACHHDLQPKGWRQQVGSSGGRLAWSPWYYTMLPQALAALGGAWDKAHSAKLSELSRHMSAAHPDRGRAAELARQTAGLLEPWLAPAQPEPLPVAKLFQTLVAAADDPGMPSWDAVAQKYLAVSALGRAQLDLGQAPPARAALLELHQALRFPAGIDSPRDFDPHSVRAAIRKLKPQPP
jgi:hypothetical protein